ncbi:MAG: cache domain-containing protein, partial [Candidatus Thorarchaeota archaeon]
DLGGTDADRVSDPWFPTQDDWYQDIVAGGGNIAYVGPYYDPLDNVLLVSIGKSIRFENGTLIGIIAGDISIQDVKDKILDVQVLETGFASLITSDGGIVAHPAVEDADYAWYDPDLPPLQDFEVNTDTTSALTTTHMVQITSGQTGVLEYVKDDEDFLLAYTQVGIGGYICAIIVPVEEALAAIPQLESRIAEANTAAISFILMVTVGGIVLAGVVAMVVTSQIAKPLQYLMDLAMRNVEAMIKQEDLATLDLRVDESFMAQDDEIGDLARAFQGMLDTIGEEE